MRGASMSVPLILCMRVLCRLRDGFSRVLSSVMIAPEREYMSFLVGRLHNEEARSSAEPTIAVQCEGLT
jgi:hypothetical protein